MSKKRLGRRYMKKAAKFPGVLFCFALAAVLMGCNNYEGLRGSYKSIDTDNDSFEFTSDSKVIVNLDGERLEGTYKITDKTILITINDSLRLVVLTLVDSDSILIRYHDLKVFTKR